MINTADATVTTTTTANFSNLQRLAQKYKVATSTICIYCEKKGLNIQKKGYSYGLPRPLADNLSKFELLKIDQTAPKFTLSEVAELTGVKAERIRAEIKKGALTARTFGRVYFFTADEAEKIKSHFEAIKPTPTSDPLTQVLSALSAINSRLDEYELRLKAQEAILADLKRRLGE